MELNACIEAVLFYKAEPMSKKSLAELFRVTHEEITEALTHLETTLTTRGIKLLQSESTVHLVTAPEISAVIEHLRKEELSADIGKAGAETLAIILYRGPLSRIEVDRIRGVNSTFIIRNLLIRGLIERRPHPTDSRSFVYATTPTLLQHLGVTSREQLPDFSEIMNALDVFEKQDIEESEQPNSPTP